VEILWRHEDLIEEIFYGDKFEDMEISSRRFFIVWRHEDLTMKCFHHLEIRRSHHENFHKDTF
jgi:hypothetical protein